MKVSCLPLCQRGDSHERERQQGPRPEKVPDVPIKKVVAFIESTPKHRQIDGTLIPESERFAFLSISQWELLKFP